MDKSFWKEGGSRGKENLFPKRFPSPLRLSLASAMALGLKPGRFYREARPFCLNLLLQYPQGCGARCSYCGLQVSRNGSLLEQSFIRVNWPSFPLDEIIERARKVGSAMQRACVSMVMHPEAFNDAVKVIAALKATLNLPLSVLISPTQVRRQELQMLKEAGAEMIGVALDLATEALFERHRGKGVGDPFGWLDFWRAMEEATDIFGSRRVSCHLIVGLGETEVEMTQTLQRVHDLKVRCHLFAFYPEKGSTLEDWPPCPQGPFRRIQLARYLIEKDMGRAEKMAFDEAGRLRDFGLDKASLRDIIEEGKAFMTSGCPGTSLEVACNRPYGDGSPRDIRSFPFPPNKNDIALIREALFSYL